MTHDNYEFLRTHEAVLTVYSVAAAEEMQLGLGSVVTLEHWCFSFFLYFIHFFFLYIFLLICFYLSLSNLIIQARDQASRNRKKGIFVTQSSPFRHGAHRSCRPILRLSCLPTPKTGTKKLFYFFFDFIFTFARLIHPVHLLLLIYYKTISPQFPPLPALPPPVPALEVRLALPQSTLLLSCKVLKAIFLFYLTKESQIPHKKTQVLIRHLPKQALQSPKLLL